MKKFKDLRIGDFVYECNFKRDEFKKYEIVNIEDSIYKNQVKLSLYDCDKINHYGLSDVCVNLTINVFNDNTHENRRELIGHDVDTFYCADKNSVMNIFNEYSHGIKEKLKHQKDLIDDL